MRIPIVGKALNPRRLIRGVGTQALGVVGYAAINKFVPNVYGRWGGYFVLGAFNLWFPLTKAILYVTKLDQKINTL